MLELLKDFDKMENSEEEKLNSIVRVRNRLGATPDSRLPEILGKLLPRLFRRVDPLLRQFWVEYLEKKRKDDPLDIFSDYENSQTSNAGIVTQNGNNVVLTSMIENIMAIFSLTIDRVELNKEIEVQSWIPQILPLLFEMKSKESSQSLVRMLEIGIPRASNDCLAKEIVPTLLQILDKIFHAFRMEDKNCENPETIPSHISSGCAWLLIEAIALLAGCSILESNGGRQIKFAKDWASTCSDVGTQQSIQAVLQQDGSGFIDLLLDITLIVSLDSYRIINSGISTKGWDRILYRYQNKALDGVYLEQLHNILMYFAFNTLREKNGEKSDRLCLLTSFSPGGWISKIPEKVRVQEMMRGINSESDKNCSIKVACCLLILIIGQEDVHSLLRKYDCYNDLWNDIVGPEPSEKSCVRPPLPINEANKARKFIVHNFRPCHGERGLEVIIHLIILAQESELIDEGNRMSLLYFGYEHLEPAVGPEHSNMKKQMWDCCISTVKDNLENLPNNNVRRH